MTETKTKNRMVERFQSLVDEEKEFLGSKVERQAATRDRGHPYSGDEADRHEAHQGATIEGGIHDLRTLDAIKEKLSEVEREVGPSVEIPDV